MKNPEGDIVIDESSTNEAPQSTLNYVICESSTSSLTEEGSTNQPISIFPNPVEAVTQLQGLDANEAWEVQILSVDGQVVHRQRGVGNGTLDVVTLPNGLYTVHLQSDSRRRALRFVKR